MLIGISKASYFRTIIADLESTCKVFSSIDDLYEMMVPKDVDILFLHLENEPKVLHTHCKELLDFAPHAKVVVFRNNPNTLEGCSLLKLGIKGYAHALSHIENFKHIYQTVFYNHVWVYPEMMQFMITEINTQHVTDLAQLTNLSAKEQEIALMVANGFSNAKIAKFLNLAEITIKKNLSTIYDKLDVKDRLTLALFIKHIS